MGQESWSPPCVFLGAGVGRRLFPEFFAGKTAALAASRGQKIRTKCGLLRTKCVRLRDLSRRAHLPRPALRGVETSEARSWRVGVRGCFRKFSKRSAAVSPPHPKFSRCENFDLSPQAGRGE